MTNSEIRQAHFAGSAKEQYALLRNFAKSPEWTTHFTNGNLRRAKGTENLCKAIISMVYGDVESSSTTASWVDESIEKLFDDYDVEGIEKLLKNMKSVLEVATEVLGPTPLGHNNLSTGTSKRYSATHLTAVPYVFSRLLKKYKSSKLFDKQIDLKECLDYYMTYELDGITVKNSGGNGPQKIVSRNLELLPLMQEVLKHTQSYIRTGEDIISKDLRETVIRKYALLDGIPCKLCSGIIQGVVCLDHIEPWSKGGATVVDNLQPAHRACNSSKHAN